MKLTFIDGTDNRPDVIQIDDARIIFRNFAGRGDRYNREGDRNFALVIPTEDGMDMVDALRDRGWNVKVKPRIDQNGNINEDEPPRAYLPVKLKYGRRGPNIYLKTGVVQRRLDEETVGIIDDIDIISVDMDIRAFDWEANGNTGRTAYLQSMRVHQETNRFMDAE